MQKALWTIASVSALALPGLAQATPQVCTYRSPQEWMPKAEAEDLARKLGYEKFFVQPEGGCWGIYSTRDGTRWEVLVDPKTGEIVRQGQT